MTTLTTALTTPSPAAFVPPALAELAARIGVAIPADGIAALASPPARADCDADHEAALEKLQRLERALRIRERVVAIQVRLAAILRLAEFAASDRADPATRRKADEALLRATKDSLRDDKPARPPSRSTPPLSTIASPRRPSPDPRRAQENAMPSASARHILVKTEAEALDLRKQIKDGATFADLAKKHSICPSGKAGGDLGHFSKGDMVPEFDKVVFGDLAIGQVSDPVKTQFGYHLLEVQKRST